MRLSSILLLTLVSTASALFAQARTDWNELVRKDKYRLIIKEADAALKRNPRDVAALYARAVALHQVYAFEEAQESFSAAKQNGVPGSAKLGNVTFDEWNQMNSGSARILPLRASAPGKKAYQIGVRSLEETRFSQNAKANLPRLLAHAKQFFGVNPNRVAIFLLRDGDALEEHWNETRLTFGKPDLERGAAAVFQTILFFEDSHKDQSDEQITETLAHEVGHVMHVLRNKEQVPYGSQHPDWWTEGIATQFATVFLGKDKAWETEQWRKEMKRVGSLPFNGFRSFFQENDRSRLHYRTASLMIRELIETHGQESIGKIIDRVAESDNYIEAPQAMKEILGVSEEDLFNSVVSRAREQTGITEEGPQLKPDERDYIPGDAVLAKDTNGRVFEPAMMLSKTGDEAYIRFFWGGQSRVSYSRNIRKFDWKRGMQVRCNKDADSEKQAVTIEGLKLESLIVRFADGNKELKYERCEDLR